MINTDETKKKNQVFCRNCQMNMNKSEYIQHLKENGGQCFGNRKPKNTEELIDKIRSMGNRIDDESQLVGLGKKNGLNGKMGRDRFRG